VYSPRRRCVRRPDRSKWTYTWASNELLPPEPLARGEPINGETGGATRLDANRRSFNTITEPWSNCRGRKHVQGTTRSERQSPATAFRQQT
jgi:hypothetical protein